MQPIGSLVALIPMLFKEEYLYGSICEAKQGTIFEFHQSQSSV